MPSHKNSGNRGSQRESPFTAKSDKFFNAYLSDIKETGKADDVYLGRVIKVNGDGRMEVFVASEKYTGMLTALIPGRFRGKGKHSVMIETKSVVLVADTGTKGSGQYQIPCLLSPEQVHELKKYVVIDSRILASETDVDELMKGEKVDMGGFEIGGGDSDDDSDLDFDTI